MAQGELLLAIDQGTTSSRAIVFDKVGDIVAVKGQEFPQIFPRPGWVEHDPEDIWQTTIAMCRRVIAQLPEGASSIAGIGITNQRETVVVWDAASGKPIYNAIVWQDRRTAEYCQKLRDAGHEIMIQSKTGLLLDPYFSASKIAWILENVEGARETAKAGNLRVGTIESFLLYRLCGRHVSDATNASRTMLYDIHQGRWDDDLLKLFNIPHGMLGEVSDCVNDFGATNPSLFGAAIPICAMIGDQQSAAIGQACIEPGMVKSTYGTGCFVLANTGTQANPSKNRLLTTVAWQLDGKRHYALEGSIFIAGAAIQWLRDGLGILSDSAESEKLAASLPDNAGVYFVPAFAGLGAPYWDAQARGAILGLTRGAGRAEIVRACLEAMSYQTHDLITAMEADGAPVKRLRVDGGMARNDWLMQDLSDILARSVDRPKVTETTALGAALLAGIGAGVYESLADTARLWRKESAFEPRLDDQIRRQRLLGWQMAVSRVSDAPEKGGDH